MKYAKGLTYDGDWTNDKRNGKGKLVWPESSKYFKEYEGDFSNNKMEG